MTCLSLAQTFPSGLASTTSLPSRDAVLTSALADVPLFPLSSVTFVGGVSPALFAGAETRWNALFGWSWLPQFWRNGLPQPRLVVGRSSVSAFLYLCSAARFQVYAVDRAPQGAMLVLERTRTTPYAMQRSVILGPLLGGTGAGATLYGDEVFVNNLVVQLDLPGLIGRSTRAC